MSVCELPGFGGLVYLNLPDCDKGLLSVVEQEIRRHENKFSRFISDSELSRLNLCLNKFNVVDDEFWQLLSQAKILESQTNGYFNIALKSLIESWGYNEKYELEKEFETPSLAGSFELDKALQAVKILSPLDFGSFGKGYFLDCLKHIFLESGVEKFMVNAGGDIVVHNYSQTVYFEDPRNANKVIGKRLLKNGYLAASSPLRRAWRNRHHLIDPLTKKPANQMLGVYVEHSESGFISDALSTVLFVMGFENAKVFVKSRPDIEALLIGQEGQIWSSEGFVGELYQLKTPSFS